MIPIISSSVASSHFIRISRYGFLDVDAMVKRIIKKWNAKVDDFPREFE